MTEQKQVKKSLLLVVVRVSVLFKPFVFLGGIGNTAEQVELAFVLDQDMDGVDKPYFVNYFVKQ